MINFKRLLKTPKAAIVAPFLLFLGLTNCVSSGIGWADQTNHATAAADAALKSSLQSYLGKPGAEEDDVKYVAAWVDLNDDGKSEAIVYIIGRSWCGSGGCVTLVLAPRGTSYAVVTRMTITWPPITVMREKSHGWHDISVTIRGGEARMKFNGKKYPGNPTIPPAEPLKGSGSGRVVIESADTHAQFVYR